MPVAASCADTEASETESPTRLIVNVDVLTAVWPSGSELPAPDGRQGRHSQAALLAVDLLSDPRAKFRTPHSPVFSDLEGAQGARVHDLVDGFL